MESQLRERGRRKYAVGDAMKWMVYVLLAVEAVLGVCTWSGALGENLAALLLVVNSGLLIWSLARGRGKPSCCR
jgi:hypothetical protein